MVPNILICPICGKRTFLRIQNGEYLYKYPIRIYCLNCHALMKGSFVMDPAAGPKGLTMFNAKDEEAFAHLGDSREIEADYIAEVSGELPCKKTTVFNGKLVNDSPYLRAASQINMEARIEQLKKYYVKMFEWEQWKSIAPQILSDGDIDFLPAALRNRLGSYPYICNNHLQALHCLQEVVREETHNLFPNQEETLIGFISLLSSIDKCELHTFVERLGGVEEINNAYTQVINTFSSFMQVYPNLLPAETFWSYKDKNDSSLCIATCSLADIKAFYQEAYETLLSLLHIPVCLDNILSRNKYLLYNSAFYDFYESKPAIKKRYEKLSDDFERFANIDNGKKAELMAQSAEQVQQYLDIPVDRDLRNAISHNSYRYDGLNQTITVFDQKKRSVVKETLQLMKMAMDCLGLAKSIVLFAEMLLFILRCEEPSSHSIMHPRYYCNLGRNEKCSCGSGKKFKNCCQPALQEMQHEAHEN